MLPTPFYRQNKTNKAVRYVLSSVHTITEAKQYAGLGRAEPGRSFDLARPGVTLPLVELYIVAV